MKFLVFLLCCYSGIIFASPQALYNASLPVASFQQDDQALKLAFRQVINRLTPGKNDPDNPITSRANPKDYLLTPPLVHKQEIRFQFNPNTVNQLMHEAGQQPWIEARPPLFVYVQWISGLNRIALDVDYKPAIWQAIEQAAKAKGLTLVPPKKSLLYRIEQAFKHHQPPSLIENIAQIGQHSKDEPVLLIFLNSNDDKGQFLWEYSALLYHGKIQSQTELKQITYDEAGQYAMENASLFLFLQDEEIKQTPQAIYLNISHVLTPKDYQSMRNFVEQMPGVVKSSINSVTVDSVLYKLEVTIPIHLLETRLASRYQALPANVAEHIINYRFLDS